MNTVLITGCSSGFGLETALFFLDKGWSVIATMRTPRDDLFPPSDRLRVLALDTTDPDSIAAAIEAAGPIDVLVNNAGIGMLSAVEGTDMAQVREIFETNTLGTIAVTKAVLPAFRQQRSGVIVNVNTSTTMKPFLLFSFYTASKAAIIAFSDCLALELEEFGVAVKVVIPGQAETRFAENVQSRASDGIPPAYADFADRALAGLDAPSATTKIEDVTEANWRAATDPDCPAHLPAGADAWALAEAVGNTSSPKTQTNSSKGNPMYLVSGATGNVGSEVATQLVQQGHGVRAFVRDEARARKMLPAGIEFAVGHLDDAKSIADATKGVEGVFFMQAEPSPEQAQSMVDAAHAANVTRIALLSSLGTRLEPLPIIGAMIAKRDEVFHQSDLEVTYLRAGGLMSNALWWRDAIERDGRVVDATDPGRLPVIDPYDVARVAVQVLTEPGHAGKGYILNGLEALTTSEQVAILADVLGRLIEFVSVTPEDLERQNIADGMAEPLANAMRNLNELFRAGRACVRADDVTNLTGIAPRTLRTWCEKHAAEFA
ncbi:MAG: SDR family NAD(P)-dependent oxidoreductase [Pseudomonadota bacterium]